jgi:hypothetical protein
MKKLIKVEYNPTVDELVETLFSMDNTQIAELFGKWHLKFEENYKEQRNKNPCSYCIHSLHHFFLYVLDDLDENGISFFRDVYSSILIKYGDDNYKKHLTDINLI